MKKANLDIEKILEKNAPLINRVIEKHIPRKFDKGSLIFALNPPRYDCDYETINKAIAEPLWEFLDRGGKRWRPTLFLLIYEALGKDPKKHLDFAIIPEVIHNGLLVIDDIEDNSESRRGKPCTYKSFGIDIAINVGNEMYFLPLIALIKNKDKLLPKETIRIYEIFAQEMINVGLGQAMDVAWQKGLTSADSISEMQYVQMCAYKTGTIARMAAKMAAVLAGANENLIEKVGRFSESISIAFQVQDDILDLIGEKFAEKKGGLGQDITEGKRTLMIIHALRNAKLSDRVRLLEIINMYTTKQNLIYEAISIIKRCGSIEYAKKFSRDIVENSWKEVDALLPSSNAKEKLKSFAMYLIEREI